MPTTKTVTTVTISATATLIWSFSGFAPADRGSAVAATQAKQGEKTVVAGADAENLLLNPGFEEGEKSPREWSRGNEVDGVEYLWDKDTAKKGKASLCLRKTANRYFPIAQWYQIVEREPGSRIVRVSAQVKAERATKAIIDVIFLDDSSEMISHEWASYIGAKDAKDRPANHDWKEYLGKVKIPEKARKIQIGLQIYGPGTVWFDEVRAEFAK